MLLQVKVTKTKPNSIIPTWGSTYAAGADLYACLDDVTPVLIQPGETKLIFVANPLLA